MICFTLYKKTLLATTDSIFTRSYALVWVLIRTFLHKNIILSGTQPSFFLNNKMDGDFHSIYFNTIFGTDECDTLKHLEIVPKNKLSLWRSAILCLICCLISVNFPRLSFKGASCLTY